MNNIRDTLKERTYQQITCDLTVGRTDNDLAPLSTDEINQFITKNASNIENVISNMIDAYAEDNELHLLEDPCNDWICEFLYDEIEYPKEN